MRNLQKHLKQAFAALEFSDANSLYALTARLEAFDPSALPATQSFARSGRAPTPRPGGPLPSRESMCIPKDGQPYR